MAKNSGVSSKREASGCSVGQLGSHCQRAQSVRPAMPSAGPSAAASSSAGVSAPVTRNHSGHQTVQAAAASASVSAARVSAAFTG